MSEGQILNDDYFKSKTVKPVEGEMKDNKIELLNEDIECVNKYLDDINVPKCDSENKPYSIVGRIHWLKNDYLRGLSKLESKLFIAPVKPSLQSVEEATKEYSKYYTPEMTFDIYDIKDAFIKGAKWQAKQAKQDVMQWVKASERIPVNDHLYFLRNASNPVMKGVGYLHENDYFVCWCPDKIIQEKHQIEWLEEPLIQ